MIGTKTFALAEALVFVHGINARTEAERQLSLVSQEASVTAAHLWEDVVHILPIAMDRAQRFAPIPPDQVPEQVAALC
jgi:hypothetical protein